MQTLAILASGTGSNARKIIEYFKGHERVRVGLVVSNKPNAGVLEIARAHQVPTLVLEKEKFFRGNGYVDEFRSMGIDFIILAGFLWKVPLSLVEAYRGKMLNIHPALLPKYGGKGMYGNFVHEAVIEAGEVESGITIHFVDEVFDHGEIVFQDSCRVESTDTPASLAQKIHMLEHEHYPRVIEETLMRTGDRGPGAGIV